MNSKAHKQKCTQSTTFTNIQKLELELELELKSNQYWSNQSSRKWRGKWHCEFFDN